jgi:hypothetical protein
MLLPTAPASAPQCRTCDCDQAWRRRYHHNRHRPTRQRSRKWLHPPLHVSCCCRGCSVRWCCCLPRQCHRCWRHHCHCRPRQSCRHRHSPPLVLRTEPKSQRPTPGPLLCAGGSQRPLSMPSLLHASRPLPATYRQQCPASARVACYRRRFRHTRLSLEKLQQHRCPRALWPRSWGLLACAPACEAGTRRWTQQQQQQRGQYPTHDRCQRQRQHPSNHRQLQPPAPACIAWPQLRGAGNRFSQQPPAMPSCCHCLQRGTSRLPAAQLRAASPDCALPTQARGDGEAQLAQSSQRSSASLSCRCPQVSRPRRACPQPSPSTRGALLCRFPTGRGDA